jgi:hypothetical protein
MKKLFRHPTKGHIEEVTFIDEGVTAQAFYTQNGYVEIPIPAQMPPKEDRNFWHAPNGVLEVNASAKAADAARDKRTDLEKLLDTLKTKGFITADDVK